MQNPYTEDEKQYGLALTRERLLGLGRAEHGELLAILTRYLHADPVNWTAAAIEVHKAVGNIDSADAELAWALLPFISRVGGFRGGAHAPGH